MKPEGSLPHSQVPATCPYPRSDQSSPCPTSHLLEIHPYIILPSTPWSLQWSPLPRLPHQNPVHAPPNPHTATCPTYLILLEFITCTILDLMRYWIVYLHNIFIVLYCTEILHLMVSQYMFRTV